MFRSVRVRRFEFAPHTPTALAVALVLGFSGACSPDVDAAAPLRDAPPTDDRSAFDAEVANGWEPLIAHSPRISPTPDWDGSLDGMKTLWYESGAKRGEGRFDHGLKQGVWTFWYEQGQMRWEGSYRDGLVDGVERAWYPSGVLNFEGSSAAGQRHGAFRAWYSDGKPWWDGTYELGVREGVFRYWQRDGRIDEKHSGVYARGKRISALSSNDLAIAPR
jgi:MORN repeat variant